MVERFPGVPVARFTASDARSLGFNITPDPEGDPDGSPEHVVLSPSTEDRGRNEHQGHAKPSLYGRNSFPSKRCEIKA